MAELLPVLLTGVVSGLVAWGGVRVELRWIRQDTNRAQKDADRAHRRIDRLQGVVA
ncbi:hypothetical protein DLM_1772 [Aquitalea magnusonii]|uniref:Uncharacterized protein n=1 Tax=Aquitalea magnusonii TaxID=332411 RepID=A0A3G9GBZ9_9NEIS|nr:hypothetical protein [Aquitalea magnusonii]BBF85388.1 hypothetical protein DLM_1772 [Aquitalea magnusonii]